MISGGNATVFVSDMDRVVEFYTRPLGLKLAERYGNHWATAEDGQGLTIGLHPPSPQHPAPGTPGAIVLGLRITVPIEDARRQLEIAGVRILGDIVRSQEGNFLHLQDPDGNRMYLWAEAWG